MTHNIIEDTKIRSMEQLAMKSIKLCNKVKNNFEAKVGETVSNPSQ
jgi:hypothetical protein